MPKIITKRKAPVKRKRRTFTRVKDKPVVAQDSLSSEDFTMLFVPDSDIPRRVRWDGYGRIRPWIATYVRKEYGCILGKCQIKWDSVKRGHWIKGPRKGTNGEN